MTKNYKNALLNFKKLSDFYLKSRTKNKETVEETLNVSYDIFKELVERNTIAVAEENTCPNCGIELESDVSFCPTCGQRVFTKKAYDELENELYKQFGDKIDLVKTILQIKDEEDTEEEIK